MKTLVGRWLPDGAALPDDVWRARHRGILILLWIHVPVLFVVAVVRGNSWQHSLVEVGVIAALAESAHLCSDRRRESTVLASLGLVASSAVLVHLSGGMIEAHFHFFVMVGVIVLYQAWWPFLIAITFVVLHHGIIGVLSPQDVYNHPAAWDHPWAWAAIHGLSVLAMSATGVATWRVSEALRRVTLDREAKLAEAQALAMLGTWEWDPSTGTLVWSDECYRIMGMDSGDHRRTYESVVARMHPDDRGMVEDVVAQAWISGGSFAVDFRFIHDRSSKWLHARGSVVPAGPRSPARMHGTCQDVTAAREAERARLRSEQLYRGIVETTREGVWVFDADFRTTFVNPQLTVMLGYTAEEMQGTHLHAYVCESGPGTEPEDRTQSQMDCKLRRKDGSELSALLSISWSVNQEGDGSISGLAMVSDITELKRTEEALARARDDAVEASRRKSQFLANTSHEIRTPMTVILGMNELLLETPMDETQQKFAEGVNRAAKALLSIINDILDFSKIEAGRIELEIDDLEPRVILDDVVAFLTGAARSKGLGLAYLCDPAVPQVILGDSTRLRQVLLNLAANAVKFTESGSVVLHTSLAPAERGSCIRFEVVDTGIGIAPDQLHLLFRPFSQVDASMTRRFGGTGLGLAIAAELVTAMGGRVGVESELGFGSTFWFEIPFEQVLALPSVRA